MRILILQLARLGDILQTLPTLQGLKKRHPGCHITLAVRAKFADAAQVSPHVDKVVELPTADVLGPVLLNGADGRIESQELLAKWIATNFLSDEPYDQVINLTFTRASSYLTTLIAAKSRLGVRGANSGGHAITDAWSQYFFSQVLNRNRNMLHLNDLFARIANVDEGTWPLEVRDIQSNVMPPADGRTMIGIQLTASESDKTLNIETWQIVCKTILARNPGAVLAFFGSSADLPTITAVTKDLTQENIRVLAGTMRFHENMPWIRACQWIVSPDTAIVHFASILKTKVIEIAAGAVRPEETGPYGEGHHVLFPVNCNASELAEQIAAVMAGQDVRPIVAHSATRLIKCSHGNTRNELAPRNFTPEESANFFTKAYYLLAEFRCAGRVEDIEPPMIGDPNQAGAVDQMLAAYDALCAIRRISDFGQSACVKMLQNVDVDNALVKAEAEKLAQLEALLENMQKTVPLVKPLIDTWSVAKDLAHCPDELGVMDVIAIAEGAYRELGQNVEIIQQLLQTAVEAAHAKRQQIKPSPQLGTKERVE